MIWDSAYLKSINATQAETIERYRRDNAELERDRDRWRDMTDILQQKIDKLEAEIRELTDPVQQAEKLFRG